MNTYIVSYDLAEGGDYEALIESIKSYGTWAHITESTWAIVSSQSSTEVRDHIGTYINTGGRLIVIKSASVGAWRNVICSNEWLKKNL